MDLLSTTRAGSGFSGRLGRRALAFDLTQLLKYFYRSGLPYLPVIATATEGTGSAATAAPRQSAGRLTGFLSRGLVDREASDLERISRSHARLPDGLLVTKYIPGDLIGALGQADQIPVLDMNGEQVQVWSSAEFLAALSKYQSELKTRDLEEQAQLATAVPEGPGAEAAKGGASGGDWLSRLVLGGFPHPLFATDLKGKTLFYNEAFEATVLAQPALKNSIRLAESYFLELTRELLARSLTREADQRMPLRSRLPEMSLALEIATLDSEGRVMGYLYVFRDLVWTGLQYELQDMLAGGMGLDDVVDEIEGALIYSVLKEHGQNVSHAAQALKVKRSTLQNKIKRLNIDEKYDRKIEGPIRRRRRQGDEGETEIVEAPAVRSALAAASKTAAKSAAKASSGSAAKKKKTPAGKQAKSPSRKKTGAKSAKKKTSTRSAGKNKKSR